MLDYSCILGLYHLNTRSHDPVLSQNRGLVMSADNNINQPDDATVGGPVLVSHNMVYDLAAQRKRHSSEVTDSASPVCSDGVCVLSWRPRKPRNDAA